MAIQHGAAWPNGYTDTTGFGQEAYQAVGPYTWYVNPEWQPCAPGGTNYCSPPADYYEGELAMLNNPSDVFGAADVTTSNPGLDETGGFANAFPEVGTDPWETLRAELNNDLGPATKAEIAHLLNPTDFPDDVLQDSQYLPAPSTWHVPDCAGMTATACETALNTANGSAVTVELDVLNTDGADLGSSAG